MPCLQDPSGLLSSAQPRLQRAVPIRSEALILVAILPQPRDLHFARVLGWYRIPLQTAPKTVRVDWIAFYLPGCFGVDRWSVRYLARLRGHELVSRRELLATEPQHPRANEPYYKLQLGPLLDLQPPIPAGSWKRFTFQYTLGERLVSARHLSDLTVPASRARDRLWHLLRERLGPADRLLQRPRHPEVSQ